MSYFMQSVVDICFINKKIQRTWHFLLFVAYFILIVLYKYSLQYIQYPFQQRNVFPQNILFQNGSKMHEISGPGK